MSLPATAENSTDVVDIDTDSEFGFPVYGGDTSQTRAFYVPDISDAAAVAAPHTVPFDASIEGESPQRLRREAERKSPDAEEMVPTSLPSLLTHTFMERYNAWNASDLFLLGSKSPTLVPPNKAKAKVNAAVGAAPVAVAGRIQLDVAIALPIVLRAIAVTLAVNDDNESTSNQTIARDTRRRPTKTRKDLRTYDEDTGYTHKPREE